MTLDMASMRLPSSATLPSGGSPSYPPHSASSSSSSPSSSHSHSAPTSARSFSGSTHSRPLPNQPYPHPELPNFPSQPSVPSITSESSSSLTSTRNALPLPPTPATFPPVRPPHLYSLPGSTRSSASSLPQQPIDTSFQNLHISGSRGDGVYCNTSGSRSASVQPSEDGHSGVGRAGAGAIPSSNDGHGGRSESGVDAGSNGSGGNPARLVGSSNPLEDLIESEGKYVAELGMIIKTVAGAWSRENLPPPTLDGMFRSIEGVWKISRAFHARLLQIGTNPSSPKVLGDLLMKWIDDMAPAYFKYASHFYPNFSSLSSVSDNKRLPEILASLPSSSPDAGSSGSPISPCPTTWTLDGLFSLPRRRVRYYRKLYSKLLRSTKEGRSDHRLLTSAVERLGLLEQEISNRLEMDLNGGHPIQTNTVNGNTGSLRRDQGEKTPIAGPVVQLSNNEVMLRRIREEGSGERISTTSTILSESEDPHTLSPFPSRGGPPGSYETPRSSTATSLNSMRDPASPPQPPPKKEKSDLIQTVIARGPMAEVSPPIDSRTITPVERYNAPPLTDLEIRLDTERTLDLFSMQPKPCKLQMRPPALPFTRKLRSSADATLYFTPTSTRREVIHARAHIFVLTDLFLMCELMTVSDKVAKAQAILKANPARAGDGGPLPEMWLLYPPLAGRHLSVFTGSQENEMIVEVMKKERFLLQVENREAREDMMQQLQDCIQFASSVSKPGNAPLRTNSNPASPRIDIQADSPHNSRPGSSDTTLSGGQTLAYPGTMMAPPPRNASLRSPTLSTSSYGSQGDGRTVSPKATPPGEWQPSQLPQRTISRPRQVSQSGSSIHHGPMGLIQPGTSAGPPQPGQIMHMQPGQTVPMRPGMVMPAQQYSGYGAPLPRSTSRASNQAPSAYPHQNGGVYPAPGQLPYNGQQIRKAPSHAQLGRNPQYNPDHAPPMPHPAHPSHHRSRSAEPLHHPMHPQFLGEGVHYNTQPPPMRRIPSEDLDLSPPTSPMDEEAPRMTGQAVVSAQMKCKVFLKQGHQQWKNLGSGRLKLYVQTGANMKQLCVEADSRNATMLISTIVLTDGVERVGKTGVAIDISDARGGRTGVVFMLQLRNEESARGLFDGLLAGSDRAR